MSILFRAIRASARLQTGSRSLHSCTRRHFTTPPPVFYAELMHKLFLSRALITAVQLRVPDLLQGTMTIEQLATASSTVDSKLDRLMKYLAVEGVFDRVEAGVYRHNSLSEFMKSDHPRSVRPFIVFRAQIGAKAVTAWADYIRGKANTPFNKAFHTDLGFWEYLCLPENAEMKKDFDGAMVANTRRIATSLVSTFPWKQYPDAHIVDVGGGMGQLLAHLLKAFPTYTGVVFDLPVTTESAGAYWKEHHAQIASRASFVGGSFFESVPSGGDLYILKHIIHDWNDQECKQILTKVAQALRQTPSKRASILVIDRIYDFPPKHTTIADLDMMMMTLISGREREMEEFKTLFESAGLKLEEEVELGTDATVMRVVLQDK